MNAQGGPQARQWETLCGARQEYLHVLAETVEKSFLSRDTTHPVFCGCIDWHSSVHGAYALLTAARLTGQTRWARVVDTALEPDGLQAELAFLKRGELEHELPYGFSWFLKLAHERERGWSKHDLLPLATEISARLGHWVFSLSDEAVVHHAQRREYGNLSWTLLNLWNWGVWKGDTELVENLRAFTRARLLRLDQACLPSLDHTTDEFFPASLQRCRALLTILSSEESSTWLASHQHGCGALSPLTMFPTAHSAGLNFSRSWGLWALFQHTQDPVFRGLYANHIVTHMSMPQYWREDYRKYGHWVPQFGIYAIALSMEDSLS